MEEDIGTPRAGMMFCKVCGAEIAKSAKACPHCGAANKKPVYRRPWFVVLCVLLALSAGLVVLGLANYRPPANRDQISDNSTATSEPIEYVCGGIQFILPSGYRLTDEGEFETKDGMALISFGEEDSSLSNAQFRLHCKDILEAWLKSANIFEYSGAVSDTLYAGCPACQADVSVSDDDQSANGVFIIIHDDSVGKIALLVFLQMDNPTHDYRSSFEEMLSNATQKRNVPFKNEASTSASADFRATMDSYEAFFDEYIAFMQKFQNSDNVMSMMTDYFEFLSKYSETMEAMESLDTSNLSNEDLAYYLEVTNRIQQKLLKVLN